MTSKFGTLDVKPNGEQIKRLFKWMADAIDNDFDTQTVADAMNQMLTTWDELTFSVLEESMARFLERGVWE